MQLPSLKNEDLKRAKFTQEVKVTKTQKRSRHIENDCLKFRSRANKKLVQLRLKKSRTQLSRDYTTERTNERDVIGRNKNLDELKPREAQ